MVYFQLHISEYDDMILGVRMTNQSVLCVSYGVVDPSREVLLVWFVLLLMWCSELNADRH